MGERPTLSHQRAAVLIALAEACHNDVYFRVGFAPIVKVTGLDRSLVRLACRGLKRLGLAEYERGLWSDDGEPKGSGYGPTRAGLAWIQAQNLGVAR